MLLGSRPPHTRLMSRVVGELTPADNHLDHFAKYVKPGPCSILSMAFQTFTLCDVVNDTVSLVRIFSLKAEIQCGDTGKYE